nr:MAG TPA_asm: hypothetical protein [Caudoviricetes sp.]
MHYPLWVSLSVTNRHTYGDSSGFSLIDMKGQAYGITIGLPLFFISRAIFFYL